MSADNGYILRKNKQGKFVLQMYSASADELPDVENATVVGVNVFDTLEDAIEAYESAEDTTYPSEYGLSVQLKKPSLDAIIPTRTNDAEVWAEQFLQRYDYVLVPQEEIRQWFAAALLTGTMFGYADNRSRHATS